MNDRLPWRSGLPAKIIVALSLLGWLLFAWACRGVSL
jgi:hypothetical protein